VLQQMPWSRFAMRPPVPEGAVAGLEHAPPGELLRQLSHVCHLEDAVRIVEDSSIRTSIVRDRSLLNRTRLGVCWLSGNWWYHGSRYGNIRFDFDWADLIRDQRPFWVEEMAYTIPAYRIVLLPSEMRNPRVKAIGEEPIPLDPYPSDEPGGPLYYHGPSGAWYFNRENVTSEFLVIRDLPLVACRGIGFEDHSDRYCNKHRNSPHECRHFDAAGMHVGSRFVAALAARQAEGENWTTASSLLEANDCWNAWSWLMRRLGMAADILEGAPPNPSLLALSKAILLAWAVEQEATAIELTTYEPSRGDLDNALNWVLTEAFPQVKGLL
jgi:hypothetical protein